MARGRKSLVRPRSQRARQKAHLLRLDDYSRPIPPYPDQPTVIINDQSTGRCERPVLLAYQQPAMAGWAQGSAATALIEPLARPDEPVAVAKALRLLGHEAGLVGGGEERSL